MSIKDQLDTDIADFFRNIEGQLPEAQKKTLKLLIDKYAHLYSTPVMLDKGDFDTVRSLAHSFFINSGFPKYIGSKRREVTQYDANVLSIIEGTIGMLNSKECFKKLPKFDYRG